MTLLINIQINLLFKRKLPIGLTSKFGNLVWPNARAALVLSVSPMFYTGFESLNSVDGLWFRLLLGPDRMYIICCLIRTLKKNTKLLTLYNNKPQHQETNTIKNGSNRIKQEH
jgi:hypothetical protein